MFANLGRWNLVSLRHSPPPCRLVAIVSLARIIGAGQALATGRILYYAREGVRGDSSLNTFSDRSIRVRGRIFSLFDSLVLILVYLCSIKRLW